MKHKPTTKHENKQGRTEANPGRSTKGRAGDGAKQGSHAGASTQGGAGPVAKRWDNEARAAIGEEMLKLVPDHHMNSRRDNLVDALTDFMHLCGPGQFALALIVATDHYDVEVLHEQPRV